MVRHPFRCRSGARLPDHPEPPPLTQIAFPACCAHYPGGLNRCGLVRLAALSSAWFFPIHSAFPDLAPGRHPHCSFRGLLKLHAYYGLPGCSPTISGLCRETPTRPVTRSSRSPAIESNHQLFEWVLPPLVICPSGAYARLSALPTLSRWFLFDSHGRAELAKNSTNQYLYRKLRVGNQAGRHQHIELEQSRNLARRRSNIPNFSRHAADLNRYGR